MTVLNKVLNILYMIWNYNPTKNPNARPLLQHCLLRSLLFLGTTFFLFSVVIAFVEWDFSLITNLSEDAKIGYRFMAVIGFMTGFDVFTFDEDYK